MANQNPFDYENPAHVENVANIAAKHRDFNKIPEVAKHLAESLSQGSYKVIEDPRIQHAIKQAGHHGYFINHKSGKEYIVRKAAGGVVPSINEMKSALATNRIASLSGLTAIGANEAPALGVKAYIPPTGRADNNQMPVGGIDTHYGDLPVGGIDMNQQQPGQQLQPGQQPGMDQVPQGDKIPTIDGTTMAPTPNFNPGQDGSDHPPAQPPSNILQMTPQGQAMAAMKPQGLAKGGNVSPDSDVMTRLLQRHYAGERLSKLENELLGLYHRVGGGKKLKKPISEYKFDVEANPNVKMAPEKLITPEDLVGGYGMPFIGDSSMAGRRITGAEGQKFHQPVELQGGHDYMRASQHEDPTKRAIWASAQGKISHLTKKAKRLGESGAPVYGVHTTMSPTGVDFSHMPAAVLAELIKNAKIKKSAVKAFDKEMRALHKQFPGVMSEELHDMLTAPGAGELRKHFVERMATDPYQEAGFPEIAMARLAVQHPNLMKYDEPGKSLLAPASVGSTLTVAKCMIRWHRTPHIRLSLVASTLVPCIPSLAVPC